MASVKKNIIYIYIYSCMFELFFLWNINANILVGTYWETVSKPGFLISKIRGTFLLNHGFVSIYF